MRIDIRKILSKRSGRYLPKWLVAPLERLIHQRELNEILSQGEGLSSPAFLRHVLDYLEVKCEAVFTAPLDESARYIFVANHPFGGLDGMLIVNELLARWSDVGAVVNDMLMNVEPLAPLWIPVNKYGNQRTRHCCSYTAAMSSPTKQVLTFPAGFCSRVIDGKVADTEWHKRFVKDAELYDRQIVPIFVEGELSSRFYNIYKFRRAMRINMNIELLLLVDEMFRQRGKSVRLVFGRPIDVATLEGNVGDKVKTIRQTTYDLQTFLTPNIYEDHN